MRATTSIFEKETIQEEVNYQEVDQDNDLLELEHDDNKEVIIISEDEIVYDENRSRMEEQEYIEVAVTDVDVTLTDGLPETQENENRLTQIQQDIYDEVDDVIS